MHSIGSPHHLVEKAYKKAGRRNKSAINPMELKSLGWVAEHKTSFDNLKSLLCDAIKLSFPNLNHAICVHTDASNRLWSGIVTHTPVVQNIETQE